MKIRFEQSNDVEKIRSIHLQAFSTDTEAKLVDALRTADIELLSLVAEEENKVIGHILFSPVTLDGNPENKIMGLAPMAVLPDWQRKGIGTQLIHEGMKACKQAGCNAVVVLGHANYYPKFGFSPAVDYGIQSEYDVPPEVFMIKELQKGSLQNVTGTIRYHRVFSEA